jgi:hypothetical protein
MRPSLLALLCALLLVCVIPPGAQSSTFYVSQETGSDTNACGTAPRASINAGIACLQPGQELVIGAGTYRELLVSAGASAPDTVPIPNGLEGKPTILRAAPDARVWLRPEQTYPGGGGVVTLTSEARWLTFEGVSVDGNGVHTNGLTLDGEHIVYTRAEVLGGKSQGVSSIYGAYHTISNLLVHHNGFDDKSHGMYVCGQNKTIEYNVVHSHAGYGIQVSCESGGVRNMTVRYNRVANNALRGIQMQGEGHRVHDNVLYKNGIGIGLNGCDIQVDHNTIASHLELPDNWAIITQGCSSLKVRNNLILDFPVRSFGASGSRYLYWGSGSPPQQAGNTCDATGMGCQVAVDGWQSLVVDLAGGNLRLIAGSPAINAGTPLGLTPDIAGLPRTTPDSGAYAYQETPPIPPDRPPPTLPELARCAFTRNGSVLAQWLCEGTAQRR